MAAVVTSICSTTNQSSENSKVVFVKKDDSKISDIATASISSSQTTEVDSLKYKLITELKSASSDMKKGLELLFNNNFSDKIDINFLEAALDICRLTNNLEGIKVILKHPKSDALSQEYLGDLLLDIIQKKDKEAIVLILQKIQPVSNPAILGKAFVQTFFYEDFFTQALILKKFNVEIEDGEVEIPKVKITVLVTEETFRACLLNSLGVRLALCAFHNDVESVSLVLKNPNIDKIEIFYLQKALLACLKHNNLVLLDLIMKNTRFFDIPLTFLNRIYDAAIGYKCIEFAKLFMTNMIGKI